jgi:hypothetical protein
MAELEGLCDQIAVARLKTEEAAALKKAADQVVDGLELKLLEVLTNLGKTSYQSRAGTFGITHRMSVRVPSMPDDKKAFFEYLQSKGVFDQMATVNSATLNAYYKAEAEAAAQSGQGMEFSIPGIGEPTINQIVTFRRSK